MQRAARMKRELELFSHSPPHGITCYVKDESTLVLEAQILGPEGSPYERGKFRLDIQLPERYPFEPPKVSFITPIYHPNIDNAGRICLDSLKMPPKGAWKPALNICTVLTSIQLLMFEPNPEDPLMTDIANEFKYHKTDFTKHATEYTLKHAVEDLTHKSSDSTVKASQDQQLGNKTGSAAANIHVTNTSSDSESNDEDDDDSDTENISLLGKSKLGNMAKKRNSEENPLMLKENIKRLKDHN